MCGPIFRKSRPRSQPGHALPFRRGRSQKPLGALKG